MKKIRLKIFRFCQLFLFSILLIAPPGQGQIFTVRCFENEDDIYDALAGGEIEYELYSALLELMREKIDLNGRDLFRLEEIPGVTRFEVAAIEKHKKKNGPFLSVKDLRRVAGLDTARIAGFVRVGKPGDGLGALRLRMKLSAVSCFDLSVEPERVDEYRVETRFGGGGRIYCSTEIPEGGAPEILRRSIEIPGLPLNGRIIAGDLRIRRGEGLVIGKGSLLPAEERVFNSESERYVFSRSGNLNGIMAEWENRNLSGTALFSMNRFVRLTDTFTGSAVDMSLTPDAVAGICASRSEISSTSGGGASVQHMIGAHAGIEFPESSFFGEAAILMEERAWGGTGGCDLAVNRLRFFLDIRRYSPRFAPFHGGGYARSDDTDFILFGEEAPDSTMPAFPSDHAGEKGIRFKSRCGVSESLELFFSLDQWKEDLKGDSHYYSGCGIRWHPSPELEIRLSGKWRELRMKTEGNRLGSSSVELRWKPDENGPRYGSFLVFKVSYPEFGAPSRKYGYWWARFEDLPIGPFRIGARLKVASTDFSDDGAWKVEWRLEEKLTQKRKFAISARLGQTLYPYEPDEKKSDLNVRLKTTVYLR